MNNILSYAQKDGHFAIDIVKNNTKTPTYGYKLTSNSEKAFCKNVNEDLVSVTGELLYELNTLGMVSRISIDNTGEIYTVEEIEKVDFLSVKGKVNITLRNKENRLVDISCVDIETEAFGDDKYKNDINALLKKIKIMYLENK